ncbi:hypothetical protein D9758_017472 [Tetrapyrgos nigripes]|uniref:Uncharacterized protein n=1 Tax=Tetrapyrgos nigripes TaxID=182062 RepID=A0A8H5FET2_9AGAR|nr:hypothetical protein D9758_017472 [Tetrapyrgos nigripes]
MSLGVNGVNHAKCDRVGYTGHAGMANFSTNYDVLQFPSCASQYLVVLAPTHFNDLLSGILQRDYCFSITYGSRLEQLTRWDNERLVIKESHLHPGDSKVVTPSFGASSIKGRLYMCNYTEDVVLTIKVLVIGQNTFYSSIPSIRLAIEGIEGPGILLMDGDDEGGNTELITADELGTADVEATPDSELCADTADTARPKPKPSVNNIVVGRRVVSSSFHFF